MSTLSGWPPADAVAAVGAQARALAPAECCGLVVEEVGGLVVRPMENQAPSPTLGFEIGPDDLLFALRSGRLRAIYHSHPEGPAALSARDVAAFSGPGGPLWPGVELWVVGLRGAAVDLARFAWDPVRSSFTRLR